MSRFNLPQSRAWRRLTLCAAVLILTGCSESTAPGGSRGFFRLATVNSTSLPYQCPPSANSPPCSIAAGELLLRPNATFTLAVDGILFLMEGTYVRAHDSITFTVPNGESGQPSFVFSAPQAGDSIVVTLSPPPIVLTFRSSPLPAGAIASATYLLTEANGRAGQPVILSDTVIRGSRYVSRVDFDSLELKDGVFFRQHRAESSTLYITSADSLRDEFKGLSYGSFTSAQGSVVLRRYFWALLGQGPTDSLAISGSTLTRTTRFSGGNRVERYSRVR